MAKTANYLFKSTTILHRDGIGEAEDRTAPIHSTERLPVIYGDSLASFGLCERTDDKPAAKPVKKAEPDAAALAAAKVADAEVALAAAVSDEDKAAAQAALDAATAEAAV